MALSVKRAVGLVALAAAVSVVGACSGNNNGQSGSASPGASSSAPASSAAASGTPAASPAAEDGPLVKYPEPVTVTTVRDLNSGAKFQDGVSLEDNVWIKSFKEDLNIEVDTKWVVSDQQYDNKVTVSMVSGDLPDVLRVNDQQLQLLIQAGQIMELNEVYDKYASELTKSSFGGLDSPLMQSASANGKLMAIPDGGGEYSDMHMIWIRNDWLKAVGMEPPKNMDDVVAIAKAFANNDPDKNGKKDTYGLSLDYNLFNGWSGLDGFFNGYHAYPFNPAKGGGINLVFKSAGGKPVFADTQPEVRTALAKLQELFREGAINPEFSVLDGGKSGEFATQGKVGMSFGAWWVGTWPINNMKKENPEVDWQSYPLVSVDGQPVKALSTGFKPQRYTVINKKAKNPEAIFKMLNYYMEKVEGPNQVESYHHVVEGDTEYSIWSLSPIVGGIKGKNLLDNAAIQAALASGDESKLVTPSSKSQYQFVKEYEAGDLAKWANNAIFGRNGSWNILQHYLDNDMVFTSAYVGPPTDTMKSKGPSLRDDQATTFTQIIMGAKPIEEFDAWTQRWAEQGGNQILEEVANSGMFK